MSSAEQARLGAGGGGPYLDHAQITRPKISVRDVIQNRLLQLLVLIAMEEPLSFNADDLRAEKERVLAAVKLLEDLSTHSACGQSAGGAQGDEEVVGYLEGAVSQPGLRLRPTPPCCSANHRCFRATRKLNTPGTSWTLLKSTGSAWANSQRPTPLEAGDPPRLMQCLPVTDQAGEGHDRRSS